MIIDLFAEWRVAARTATAAERAVSNAYRRFFQGVGEPPTIEAIAEAKRKRDLADDLFIVAMGSYPVARKP
ncbi:MAG TPA: hypothetical protein VKP68_14950 [Ramlibacter sp.]|nr:hypothetical protein [Ramlibacter sp.]